MQAVLEELTEGDRLDHHMLCAVIDVAHLVAIHSPTTGDPHTARAAAELALLPAPHEENPRLDLGAGHCHEAERIARDIFNRTGDNGPTRRAHRPHPTAPRAARMARGTPLS